MRNAAFLSARLILLWMGVVKRARFIMRSYLSSKRGGTLQTKKRGNNAPRFSEIMRD